MYPHLFYGRYTQATLTLSEHNKEVNIMGTNKQNVNTTNTTMKGGEKMKNAPDWINDDTIQPAPWRLNGKVTFEAELERLEEEWPENEGDFGKADILFRRKNQLYKHTYVLNTPQGVDMYKQCLQTLAGVCETSVADIRANFQGKKVWTTISKDWNESKERYYWNLAFLTAEDAKNEK